MKPLPTLTSLLASLLFTGCYANFRTEDYSAVGKLPKVGDAELDLEVIQANAKTPGLIYRSVGPYQMSIRLTGDPAIHRSAVVRRLIVRDRATGKQWNIARFPVSISFVSDKPHQDSRAGHVFEKRFQPVYEDDKILEVRIDIGIQTTGGSVIRKTLTIPFKAHDYEFKGFVTLDALMGA